MSFISFTAFIQIPSRISIFAIHQVAVSMNRIYLFLFPALLSLGTLPASAACKTDSSYFYTFNDSNTSQELTGRSYHYFDGDFLRETINLYLDIQNSRWENNYRYVYTEYADALPETSVLMFWDPANKTWLNYQRTTAAYDSNMSLIRSEIQSWDSLSDTWENSNLVLISYDEKGVETMRVSLDWNGSDYINNLRHLHTYDANGLKTETLVSLWDDNTKTWAIKSKQVFTYTHGKETERVTLYWDAGNAGWNNSSREQRSYNSKNQLTVFATQYWNNGWTNDGEEQYSYNASGCPSDFHFYANWSPNDSNWGLHTEERYFSSGFLGLKIPVTTHFSLYPNPSGGFVNIRCEVTTPYTIYTSNGVIVGQGIFIEGETRLDTRPFQAGIYLVKTGQSTYKLLVQ